MHANLYAQCKATQYPSTYKKGLVTVRWEIGNYAINTFHSN